MLVRFLAKRAAVAAFIAAVAGFFISGYKASVPFGVLLGACVSVYKTRLFGSFLANLAGTSGTGAKAAVYQILSHLLVFGLLIAAIFAETGLFFGIATGLLTVPAVIVLNAFTESAGLTRNNWGEVAERGKSRFGKGN